MVAFPSIATTFAYLYTADAYFVAMMFACIAAYLVRKTNIKFRMVLSAVFICCSLGIYQAYFGLAVTLIVLSFVLDVLDKRIKNLKIIIKECLSSGGALIFGLILYAGILKILLKIKNTELSSYAGINEMGHVTFNELVNRVITAYKCFFQYFLLQYKNVYNSYIKYFFIFVLVFIVFLILFIVLWQKIYKNWIALIFLMCLIIVIPLAGGIVFVMTKYNTVHYLMIYPFCVIPIVIFPLLNRVQFVLKNNKLNQNLFQFLLILACGCMLTIGWEYYSVTNKAYFKMDLVYEEAYAYFNRMIMRIESMEDFTEDTKLAIVGKTEIKNDFLPSENLTGILSTENVVNMYTRELFITYFINPDVEFVNNNDILKIQNSSEFKEMENYPSNNSIKNINGIMVVKLNDDF